MAKPIQLPKGYAVCPHCELIVKGDLWEHTRKYCPVARHRRENAR